ncbi:MAG: hypothetical protein HUJ86_05730, partial [Synergistes sp.]|nr:hypothetical protein [Synergistes sp.]
MKENEEREEPSFAGRSKREKLQRDLLWGKEHENDSDEELLAYLRNAAETLGRVPAMKDVIGGHY